MKLESAIRKDVQLCYFSQPPRIHTSRSILAFPFFHPLGSAGCQVLSILSLYSFLYLLPFVLTVITLIWGLWYTNPLNYCRNPIHFFFLSSHLSCLLLSLSDNSLPQPRLNDSPLCVELSTDQPCMGTMGKCISSNLLRFLLCFLSQRNCCSMCFALCTLYLCSCCSFYLKWLPSISNCWFLLIFQGHLIWNFLCETFLYVSPHLDGTCLSFKPW